MTWQDLLFGPPLITETILSETPEGAHIRLPDLHPPRAFWVVVLMLILTAFPLLLVSLSLLWPINSDTAAQHLLVVILITGSVVLGQLLLSTLQSLRLRWHYEVDISNYLMESHRCMFEQRKVVACVEVGNIRRILVKDGLRVETVDDRTVALQFENLPGVQQQLFRWIVDVLIRRSLLPSLHYVDATEARVERLPKPPGSKLIAEETQYRFHVEFPLPVVLPDEQNRRRSRQLALAAIIMVALAFLVFLPATIVTGRQFGGCFGVSLFVGFAALIFSLLTAVGQSVAEQQTQHITHSLCAADGLLIRTDARGCKTIWDRVEIKDVRVEVEIGQFDSESNAKMPDILNLCLIKHSRPAERIHSAQHIRRAEMEWIASQLRHALHLIEVCSVPETPPSSTVCDAIRAERWLTRHENAKASTMVQEGVRRDETRGV
jgi:hypothetical protein